MDSPYGFTITAAGWNLLGRLVAGNVQLQIVGVAFGSGKLENAADAINLTELINPVADGSTSVAKVTPKYSDDGTFLQEEISFICEYRSNGVSSAITGIRAADVTYQFNLNEFGVFALDPATNEIVMVYYGTLGDCPQPVTPYSQNAIDFRRFPVTIVISSELEVTLSYPPVAFVTYEEMEAYAADPCLPKFIAEALIKIAEHNVDKEAHPDIRNLISGNSSRLDVIEAFLNGEESISFNENFANLDSVNVTVGTFNASQARIEF